VNAQIPGNGLSGTANVQISANGVASNTVTVAIQ
jgi:hypothetical protein